ncbi:MAG: hypothetical protein E7679_00720 [Ruminococcaceae bacterium]|nr:hypothetical protein [Oscillospiraceae bacterium]
MINKYIHIYNRRNCLLAFFCASIGFIPSFIVSLIYDVIPKDTLIAFAPFVIAAICVAIASLYTIRFKKMIKMQEQLYGVQFNDDNVIRLEATLYLSQDWLIRAGISSIYKSHIKSINSKLVHGKGGSSNKVTIKTVDNKKYIIWCLSSSNVNKIRKWKNNNTD